MYRKATPSIVSALTAFAMHAPHLFDSHADSIYQHVEFSLMKAKVIFIFYINLHVTFIIVCNTRKRVVRIL